MKDSKTESIEEYLKRGGSIQVIRPLGEVKLQMTEEEYIEQFRNQYLDSIPNKRVYPQLFKRGSAKQKPTLYQDDTVSLPTCVSYDPLDLMDVIHTHVSACDE